MTARQPATVVFGKQLVLRQNILFECDRCAMGCCGNRHFGQGYGRVIEGYRRLRVVVFMNMFVAVHVAVVFVNVSFVSFVSMTMRACMQMLGHAHARRPGRKLPPQPGSRAAPLSPSASVSIRSPVCGSVIT